MELSGNNFSRRGALKSGLFSFGAATFPSLNAADEQEDEKLVFHEIKAIGKIDEGQYESLWNNMAGITDDELDWKIHPEANTVRWIVGHLTWFDEWIADAIHEKGMYLDSERGPESFQDRSFENMKERFSKARDAYRKITRELKPRDLDRKVRFVPNKLGERPELSLHSLLLSIHPTHLAGHRYQVRFIRGTYSRYAKTDKTTFDKF